MELLVAITVFGVVSAMALTFLKVQNQGLQRGLNYMATVQALRSAVGVLEQDIQTAGTHLVPGQPEVVYADGDVIAFNADYASRMADDPFAVFYDPDLEDQVGMSMRAGNGTVIPNSEFVYPDTTYLNHANLPGSAETLIFFFRPDDETVRKDDFVLYRQVNAESPQAVARNLLRAEGQPFFRYLRKVGSEVEGVSDHLLPLAHRVPMHGSPADTGRASLVDSIRAVSITLQATNGAEGEGERISKVTRIVRMPNLGLGQLEGCGSPPILGTGLTAAQGVAETGESVITLAWNRATDEGGGEMDVVRYVIWKRQPGTPDWGDPFVSIPAGNSTYSYQDGDLEIGETYQYALAAQDCTPTLSPITTSAAVTVVVR
jgi:hypothetical protein